MGRLRGAAPPLFLPGDHRGHHVTWGTRLVRHAGGHPVCPHVASGRAGWGEGSSSIGDRSRVVAAGPGVGVGSCAPSVPSVPQAVVRSPCPQSQTPDRCTETLLHRGPWRRSPEGDTQVPRAEASGATRNAASGVARRPVFQEVAGGDRGRPAGRRALGVPRPARLPPQHPGPHGRRPRHRGPRLLRQHDSQARTGDPGAAPAPTR